MGFFKPYFKLNKVLLQSMSGIVFLINPSIEVIKNDYNLTDKKIIQLPFEMDNEYFKTPKEIDTFFLSANRVSTKNINKYLTIYKPLILSASNIFKIPFSFQSCLIFKESRFDKNALSAVGAMGMAQFTKDTYHFLSRALRIGQNSLEHKRKKILNTSEFFFVESNSNKLSYPKYNTRIFTKIYRMWLAYLISNDLKEINLSSKSFKNILYKPEYSIGLSSMYLYYLKYRVRYGIRKHIDDEDPNDPNFILSIAGAYNQGPRRVLKAIKKDSTPKFLTLIAYQSKIRETKDYISSIRNCMRKNSNTDYVLKKHLNTKKITLINL